MGASNQEHFSTSILCFFSKNTSKDTIPSLQWHRFIKTSEKRLKAMKNHWRTKSIKWTTVSKIILLIRCENERIYQCRVSNQEPTSEFLVAIEFLTRTAFGSIRIYSLKSLFGWRFLFLQQFFIHLNLDRLNLFAELFYHSKHHLN